MGLAVTDGRLVDCICGFAREDVDLLNGFLKAGYTCRSKAGTGGASAVFPLLKAFLKDAKDGFFEKDEFDVVTDECDE